MADDLLISIPSGHTVRNLLENGLLDRLLERDFAVTLLTPAHSIPAFHERWVRPGVRLAKLASYERSRTDRRLTQVRRLLAKRGWRIPARTLLGMERRKATDSIPAYLQLLDERSWAVVLATHVHLPHERPLLNAARQRGIPTLGLVNSWDNVYKGINAHPDVVLVWNEINRQELIDFEGYEGDRIIAIGAPAFDPYFAPETLGSREAFCQQFGLDPSRPILLYATIGQYVEFFEETYLLEALLQAIDDHCFSVRPQVICRLHPWSMPDLYAPYRNHPDVRFSRYEHYVPTLDWCPTYEETVLAANLLYHSDVCLTPGSTMALEAAIFDTPTLVPVFNDYQPEVWDNYYARYCLAWHFGRLVQEDMLPLVRSYEEMVDWINRYLIDPLLYQQGRKRIVQEYVQFTDGRSVERLIDQIMRVARQQPMEATLA